MIQHVLVGAASDSNKKSDLVSCDVCSVFFLLLSSSSLLLSTTYKCDDKIRQLDRATKELVISFDCWNHSLISGTGSSDDRIAFARKINRRHC
jgi:hypothetical protein